MELCLLPNSKQVLKVWGVINFTPDSFSDGGHFTNSQQVLTQIQDWPVHGVDIGAESTNPKAHAITVEEERKRLERGLLPILNQWPQGIELSLDTYKIETIRWILPLIPATIHVTWNDVSGQLNGVSEILRAHPNLHYICSHNPAPSRDLSGRHKDYVTPGLVTSRVKEFFQIAANHFQSEGVFDRVIADPCFGFGKSREQNHELMETLPQLMNELPFNKWMWGVSRKSFLRTPATQDPKDPQVQEQLDQLQLSWIVKSLEKLETIHTIILRAHNPASLKDLWKNSDLKK